jgi:hypothetical protein
MVSIWGVVGAIFIAKFVTRALWRRRMWRHGYGFHGGCGYGRRARWRRFAAMHQHMHHPYRDFADDGVDLGEYEEDDFARAQAGASVDVAAKIDELLRGLDLNARQAAEASDVVSLVRGAVGGLRYSRSPELLLAFRAAGKAPFDQDLAVAALGPKVSAEARKEALDAFEHLHNILTEEQRAALLRLTARA